MLLFDIYNIEKLAASFIDKKFRNINFYKNFAYIKDGKSIVKYTYKNPIDFEFAIEYESLSALSKLYNEKANDEIIDIKLSKNGILKCSINNLKTTIKTIPLSPEFEIPLESKSVKDIDIIDKASIASNVILATSSFPSSIFMDVNASDGKITYSLASMSSVYYYEDKYDDEFHIQIPIRNIIGLKNVMNFEEFGVSSDNKWVYVKVDNVIVFSLLGNTKIIDMRSNSYSKIVQKESDVIFIINKNILIGELEKVSLFTEKDNGVIKVVIHKDNNNIYIESENTKLKCESISCDKDFEPIGFNVILLLKAIKGMKGDAIDMYYNQLPLFVDDKDNRVGVAKIKLPEWFTNRLEE